MANVDREIQKRKRELNTQIRENKATFAKNKKALRKHWGNK